jgi:glycosyltransferase involved in cell wall biosynthesis
MKNILVVIGHYLPSYKMGGPVRSLANVVDRLGDEFRFSILTRDRDLGDPMPFPNVVSGIWQAVGNAHVMYLPASRRRPDAWWRLLKRQDYDLLYLNSLFDQLTVQTVTLRRFGLLPDRPLLLAPRGECSPGALSLKRFKKLSYLAVARATGLHSRVCWHASTYHEALDILAVFGSLNSREPKIRVAPNLPRLPNFPIAPNLHVPKQRGKARLVYLSRVARMKNLDFALRLLDGLSGKLQFDIYGPLEDTVYWRECRAVIGQLPANVEVAYHGAVVAERVPEILASAHLCLLPSLSENFGHVILEALSAGCPVLISDQTPWRGLACFKAGWDIPLTEPERFRAALAELIEMDEGEFTQWSEGARIFSSRYTNDPDVLQANRDLFLRALEES